MSSSIAMAHKTVGCVGEGGGAKPAGYSLPLPSPLQVECAMLNGINHRKST